MSDFLTRLAARQLGTTPGVAPRLRARFEPAVGDETLDLPGPVGRPQPSRDHDVVPDPPPVTVPARAGAAEPAGSRPAPVAAEAELVQIIAEEPPAADDVRAAPTADRHVGARPADVERPRLEPPAPAAAEGDDPRGAGPAVLIREVTRDITTVRVETDGEQAAPPRAPRRPERLVPIPDARRAEHPGSITVAEPHRPAKEPPVIEVRIGRVDVRAVPPPPAPPARTPRRTAPSLDEYLEQRREAKR